MKYDRHIDKTEERKLQEKLRYAGDGDLLYLRSLFAAFATNNFY